MAEYHEQRIGVAFTKKGDAAPIRITFGNHSLLLTEIDAAWLAENIQRAIRDMTRASFCGAYPLKVAEKRTLQPGDWIAVREDGVDSCEEVDESPRHNLHDGQWYVSVKNRGTCVPLACVTGIISTAYSRGPKS